VLPLDRPTLLGLARKCPQTIDSREVGLSARHDRTSRLGFWNMGRTQLVVNVQQSFRQYIRSSETRILSWS